MKVVSPLGVPQHNQIKDLDRLTAITAGTEVKRLSGTLANPVELVGASLRWERAGTGWRLLDGRRRFGAVVPDARHPAMWRSLLSGGRLSDMANLAWAKHAVFEAAIRELEWEVRRASAIDPRNCPVNEGGFEPAASCSENSEPVGSETADEAPAATGETVPP